MFHLFSFGFYVTHPDRHLVSFLWLVCSTARPSNQLKRNRGNSTGPTSTSHNQQLSSSSTEWHMRPKTQELLDAHFKLLYRLYEDRARKQNQYCSISQQSTKCAWNRELIFRELFLTPLNHQIPCHFWFPLDSSPSSFEFIICDKSERRLQSLMYVSPFAVFSFHFQTNAHNILIRFTSSEALGTAGSCRVILIA